MQSPSVPPAAAAAAPLSEAACAAAIRSVAGRPSAARVPARCWRVGPLVVGMSTGDVRDRLGAPDFEDSQALDAAHPRRPYAAVIYVFPRNLRRRLAGRPSTAFDPRLLTLLFRDGRLVRIETSQSSSVESGRCLDGRPAPAPTGASDAASADFKPFQHFATVRVGDPPAVLTRTLGAPATISTARDFYAYDPAPLTFEVEPRVLGFAVSADRDAEFAGYAARMSLHHRANDCRIDGFAFLPVRDSATSP